MLKRTVRKPSVTNCFLLLSEVVLGLACALSAQAQTLTYNPGTIAAGSSARWDTSTTNWLNGVTPAIWPNTTSATATFGGPAVAINVQSAGVSDGNLIFNATGYTVGGGSLTLAGSANSAITVGSTYSETITSALLGGFTKSGTGTLILANTAAANTGDILAAAGTLKYGASNQIADTATLSVSSGATVDLNGYNDTLGLSADSAGTITNSSTTASTLTFSNTGALTYSGVLAGTLNLSDTTSSGGLTLAGTSANTNTGTTTFNAAVQNYLNKTGVNAIGGAVVLNGGGLTLLQSNQILDTARVTITLTGVTSALRFNLNGNSETIGSLASTGANTTSPAVELGSGTLTVGKDNTSTTFAGIIDGSGSVVKTGTGTWTLSGANTFTGGLTISGGTASINSDAVLGISGGTTYAPLTLSGGTLATSATLSLNTNRTVSIGSAGASFNPSASTTLTLPIALTNLTGTPGSFTKVGLGTLLTQVASGTPLGTGSVLLSSGTLSFAPAIVVPDTAKNVTLTAASGLTTSTLSYGIGNALVLTKGSETSLTLTVGNAAATANSVLVRSGVGTLLLQPTVSTNLGVSESLLVNGGVAMTNSIVNPSIVIQDKTSGVALRGDFATYNSTAGMKLATYTDTNFAASATTSIEAVTANTSLATQPNLNVYALKVGAGDNTIAPVSLTLTGQVLTVGQGSGQAGVLLNGTVGGTHSPGAASIVGGTLAFGGAEGTLYAGTGGGSISSILTGSGGVTVFGSGILTLSGANAYTGSTNINSVTSGGMTLQTGATNTLPAATFVSDNAGSVLALNSFNQTIAELTSSGGTTLGTAVLTVGDSGNYTYSGVASGTGSLVKVGSGTMNISGSNTFTGGTNITAGTLQLGRSNALATTGDVAVSPSAFLDLDNNSQTVGRLTGGGAVINSGTSTPTLTVGNTNFSSTVDTAIRGLVALTKAGTGTDLFTGTNTYTGATTVTAGVLEVGATAAIPTTTALTVGGTAAVAASFDLDGYNVTVGSLNSGTGTGSKLITSSAPTPNIPATLTVNGTGTYAGVIADGGAGTVALTKSNTGALVLAGTNTYTGATTINAGTLTLNNDANTALGRLANTSGITINNSGTLLFAGSSSVNDRLNDSASINLNTGGKLNTGGLSEGASATGSSAGISMLAMQGGSTLDFSSGANGSTILAEGATLTLTGSVMILNWTGAQGVDSGAAGNDRLLFVANPNLTASQLSQFQFSNDNGTAFAAGGEEIAYDGFTEIVPLVPEPAAWVYVLAGCAVATGYARMRRVRLDRGTTTTS